MQQQPTTAAPKTAAEKTGYDWLQEISHEPTRELAIKRAHEREAEPGHEGQNSEPGKDIDTEDALLGAFGWRDTPEGFDYWNSVADALRAGNDAEVLANLYASNISIPDFVKQMQNTKLSADEELKLAEEMTEEGRKMLQYADDPYKCEMMQDARENIKYMYQDAKSDGKTLKHKGHYLNSLTNDSIEEGIEPLQAYIAICLHLAAFDELVSEGWDPDTTK